MENAAKSLIDNLNVAFSKENVPVENKYNIIKNINKYEMGEQDKNKSKLPEDFLIDPKTMREIYLLAKNKKLSSNNIRKKIKEYLKNPEDLNKFLHSILDSKTKKKEENTEATSSGGSGQFSSPLFSTTKKNVVKTVREGVKEIKKVETKEATSSSSSGQYSQPAIWAKSTSKKDWKGASTKYMPGAKRVQVRSKCKKFPYCNQGDIKALKIFESETVQNAIDSVSSGYGYNKDYISKIVFREIEKRQN